MAFGRIYTDGGMNEDLEHLSGHLAELYGRIPVIDIKRADNAALREQAKQNSVAHLLLGVVERVVPWSDYDIGRTSGSERIFNGFREAHELAVNLRTGVNKFPGAPA